MNFVCFDYVLGSNLNCRNWNESAIKSFHAIFVLMLQSFNGFKKTMAEKRHCCQWQGLRIHNLIEKNLRMVNLHFVFTARRNAMYNFESTILDVATCDFHSERLFNASTCYLVDCHKDSQIELSLNKMSSNWIISLYAKYEENLFIICICSRSFKLLGYSEFWVYTAMSLKRWQNILNSIQEAKFQQLWMRDLNWIKIK